MEQYLNLSGDSGVASYECGADWVKVRFRDGSIYVYDYAKPGPAHVERMQELARTGRGLSTYISQHVRTDYARREG